MATVTWLWGVVILHKIPGRWIIRSYLLLILLIHCGQTHGGIGSDSYKRAEDLVKEDLIKEGFIVDVDMSGDGPSDTSDYSSQQAAIADFVKKTMSPRRENDLYVPPFSEQGKKFKSLNFFQIRKWINGKKSSKTKTLRRRVRVLPAGNTS